MVRGLLWVVVVFFPVSEIALAVVKRSRGPAARREDRGSLRLLWLGIVVGIGLAIAAQWISAARWRVPAHVSRLLALGLLSGGLVLRWWAIVTLGRLFTVDVAIQDGHAVVQTGLYRFVRHPSYTGLLVAFLGLGVFFANWLSMLGLLVPVSVAVLNRVRTEEHALLSSLGPDYAAYCARTKRFIPRLL